MSPRSLFNVILKVLGIICIKDILVAIPTLFSSIYFAFNTGNNFIGLLFILFSILIYISVGYLLLFRSDWIIDKLAIEKSFPNEIFSLNVHRSVILQLTILIIGGLLVIDTIPILLGQVIAYWREKNSFFNNSADARFIIIYSVKLLLGLLMIGNVRPIVNFIELKRRRTTMLQPDSSADQ